MLGRRKWERLIEEHRVLRRLLNVCPMISENVQPGVLNL